MIKKIISAVVIFTAAFAIGSFMIGAHAQTPTATSTPNATTTPNATSTTPALPNTGGGGAALYK